MSYDEAREWMALSVPSRRVSHRVQSDEERVR